MPVDGFYEWQKRPAGKKQPYAIVSADGKPFAMAGLWENWKEPQSGETVRTFTIITGPPNELVAPIHNRMPVILPPSHWRAGSAKSRHRKRSCWRCYSLIRQT